MGHNNSKDLDNIQGAGTDSEKIFDNISIGHEGSAYGSKTIAIGNYTKADDANKSTIIGHSNVATSCSNVVLMGTNIENTGNNTLIINPLTPITNNLDNYFNIANVFTGITSQDSGEDTFLEFHLDKFVVNKELVTQNLQIEGDVISLKSTLLSNVVINGTLEVNKRSTFNDECYYNRNVIFNGNNMLISKYVNVNDRFVINEEEIQLHETTRFTNDVHFEEPVDFPVNQTFNKNTIFADAIFDFSGDNMELRVDSADHLIIGELTFSEYLREIVRPNLPYNLILPTWIKSMQNQVDLKSFNNDRFAPWIHANPKEIDVSIFDTSSLLDNSIPWLKDMQDPSNLGLEIFNKDNFGPWIQPDPSDIDASLFNYDNLVKGWVVNKLQNEVNLSLFNNDNFIKDWALKEQSYVDLHMFRNSDFIKDWALKEQDKVAFSGFSNDSYKWLDELSTTINNISLEDDLTSASIVLRNKISPWIRAEQRQIRLSAFTNDIISWSNDIEFFGNVSFRGPVEFDDVVTMNSNLVTNATNTFNGETVINGDFRIGDALSVVGGNVNITGNFSFYDDLLSIDPETQTYNIHTNAAITSSLSAFYDETNDKYMLHVSQNSTTIENDLVAKRDIIIHPESETNDSWWKIYSKPVEIEEVDEQRDPALPVKSYSDIVFESKNGSVVLFNDTFEEDIINFTGQHRCKLLLDGDLKDIVGKIVVSTGEYCDLFEKKEVRINESIPIVKIVNKKRDKSVFGVISGIEKEDNVSTFSIGHIRFLLNKTVLSKKAMINSVGEGAVWVCDVNGDFENGDYITSSHIDGLGMNQMSSIRMNHTVAKITCDCNFDEESIVYKCVSFEINGIKHKKAFVGCIYCC